MIGSLLSYLRNLFAMRSQAFTCCAGCHALPAPVGNRLCVSRRLELPVDAVLTGEWDAPSAVATCEALRKALPCLGRFFAPPAALEAAHGGTIAALPEGVDEANLHLVQDLAEHFLALPGDARESPPQTLLVGDFFTPNGLPLLFAAPGGSAETPNFRPGPAGRTKSLDALFASACAADPALAGQRGAAGHALAFARWAYAERHGIPAPSPFMA